MMRSILALFLCAATIGQASAQAFNFTGKKLFDLCSTGGNNAAFFSCLMYIRGFFDGYRAREETICFPENLTPGEAAAAFVRVWRSIEAKKGASNMGPVADATSDYAFTALVMAAYPCKAFAVEARDAFVSLDNLYRNSVRADGVR